MNPDVLRMGVAAAVVAYALGLFPLGGGGGNPLVPVAPYSGPLMALHSAASSMEAKDRESLSETMNAAATMVKADKVGLIKNTKDLQNFVLGTIEYGYTSFSLKQYPEVSRQIQSELQSVIGDEETSVDSSQRAAVAMKLEEIGKAVK